MRAKVLNVRALGRFRPDDDEERLEFTAGVNLLVGPNNAGKTKWLSFLDFLLGDTGQPEAHLADLAEKYDSAYADLTIGGEPVRLDRNWKEPGGRGRIYVNGRPVPAAEFSGLFLEMLGMPVVHFPRGNPIDPQRWVELTWRNVLRHVYRHEGSWHELAERQIESEQFAVIALFVGAAEALFSEEYGTLAKQVEMKRLLESKKENFEDMLEEIGRELVTVPEAAAGFTKDAIVDAIADVEAEVSSRKRERDAILRGLRDEASADERVARGGRLSAEWDELGTRLEKLRVRRAELSSQAEEAAARASQLHGYRDMVRAEIARLKRAERAGDALAGLVVTKCPVCDQEVEPQVRDPRRCYLCQRPVDRGAEHDNRGVERITFELRQLSEQVGELDGLIKRAEGEASEARRLGLDAGDEIARIEETLAPLQTNLAWLIPTELSEADREIGRLEERIRQLRRIETALDLKAQLTKDIEDIERRIARLRVEVERKRGEPSLESVGDLIADAMSNYLNALDKRGHERWGRRRITVDISSDRAVILVNNRRWQAVLGANLRALMFLAYHFAWLRLCRTEPFCYPGLVILDFPPNLSEELEISGTMNYLVRPFIRLLSRPELKGTQLIAAGRSFEPLPDAHYIPLKGSFT